MWQGELKNANTWYSDGKATEHTALRAKGHAED